MYRDEKYEVFDYLAKKDAQRFRVRDFISRHDIKVLHRAKMVDWMIEVLYTFKCSLNTLFLAVQIMDRYFGVCHRTLNLDGLHLLGVTAMFMASKYEDIKPLNMKTVYNKIAHTKLSEDSIRQMEAKIVQAFNFEIAFPTCWEFFEHLAENSKNEMWNEEKLKHIKALGKQYMMGAIHDIDIVTSWNELQVATAAFQLAVKTVSPKSLPAVNSLIEE